MEHLFLMFLDHTQRRNTVGRTRPSYRGDSRTVFVVGQAGPTTNTARLSPRYEYKTRGCHCSHCAPDDGRENARNMLSCK